MSAIKDQDADAWAPKWPIFVLSLDGDDARRAPLLQALKDHGLEYQLILGIDGRSGLPDRWSDQIDRQDAAKTLGRQMTDGEFACALSHREMYRDIVERRLPGAIILEDDAVIGQEFVDFCASNAFEQADLMLLDHSHAHVRGKGINVLAGVWAQPLSLPASLTSAYSISASGAVNLLRAASPVCALADWPGDIVALGALALNPRIVRHQKATTRASHLRVERRKAESHNTSFTRAYKRWSSLRTWINWITKRLSKRIS